MENYIKQYGLKPGDSFAVSENEKGRAAYKAVYLGIDQYKRHFIGKLNEEDGKVTLHEIKDFFSRDNDITDIDKHEHDWDSRQNVVNEALGKVGQFSKLLDLDVNHFRKEYNKERNKKLGIAIGAGLGVLAAAGALVMLKLKKEI